MVYCELTNYIIDKVYQHWFKSTGLNGWIRSNGF